jgi:hypothetical protein
LSPETSGCESSHGQEVGAAKAGISVRSARRLDIEALPSQRDARTWRSRADPFKAVWHSEIVPMPEASPALTATTLLEEMQRRHPGKYDDALVRAPQRRVRTWGASHGAEREVFFAQAHTTRPSSNSMLRATCAGAVDYGACLGDEMFHFAVRRQSMLDSPCLGGVRDAVKEALDQGWSVSEIMRELRWPVK